MLFSVLAETSAAVGAMSSRLAKRSALAATIAAAAPDEIGLVVTLLSGSLRQRRTGIGWASIPQIESAAAQPTLTVGQVDAAFESIAALSGPGSALSRTAAMGELFAAATPPEQSFLRGLVFGEVRQGALDSLVRDAVASAFGIRPAGLVRAAMLLGSTAEAAEVLSRGGEEALTAIEVRVGRPIQPMLAASAPDPQAAVAKSGLPAIVDTKLDGIRVQIHRTDASVQVFTRSLDDITDRVPEIVDAVSALAVDSIILDGEVIALGTDGRPLPFQVIASRTASRLDVAQGQRQTPLTLFCFDLLEVDGRGLMDLPLSDRAKIMTNLLPPGMIVPRTWAETSADVEAAFAAAVTNGFEGAVVKKLDAPYAAGRRDSGWIKLKPRHTFDLAVTAAEWGYGRREGLLSNLHLAAADPETGRLIMLGKTFKGLTDETLRWQTEQVLAREVRRTKGTVFIDPPLVVEIACDGIQKSSRYPGGIALRFARVLRYRHDKNPEEIDTIKTVIALNPFSGDDPDDSA